MSTTPAFKLMPLAIPASWTVLKNEFYDLSDTDNLSERDWLIHLFGLEDMLMATKGTYCLDLGWYGGADMQDPYSGYCIHLMRGEWYNGDLLERFSSKDRHLIAVRMQHFIRSVDEGAYEGCEPIPWVKDKEDGSALAKG